MLSNTTVAIIIGVVIVAAIGIALALYFAKKKAATTTGEEGQKTDTTTTTATPTTPPSTDKPAYPVMQIGGRTFTFHRGQDWTWIGRENAFTIEPFTTVEAAGLKCLSLSGCVAFVVYRGNVYYRPAVVVTAPSAQVTWDFEPTETEGTYILS
ncbi:MAG: hypothetical protein WC483_01125 [Candidatus Paceibacterota bacterium]